MIQKGLPEEVAFRPVEREEERTFSAKGTAWTMQTGN